MAEKISSITLYALLGIGVLVFLMGMIGGSYEAMIYVAYLYGAISIIAALAASILGAMNKPGTLKGSIIGIVGMLVIFGLSYVLADGTVEDYYGSGVTETAVKWSGAGLYMLYILALLTVGSIVYSGVIGLTKK